MHNKSYDFGLLLHAYKSGRVWLSFNLDIPYVLIYGGTDLNENISNSQDKTIIDALTLGAAHRICFSKDFDIICNKLWPSLHFNFQPQAVPTGLCRLYYSKKYILLICGIRKVKDPLFAIQCWNHFKKSYPDYTINFKIVGPVIDHVYAKEVFKAIDESSDIKYLPFVPHSEMMDILSGSFVTVNSSESEGQSAAVLESMSYGVPVLARDIPGNSFIVDEKNGLKFSSEAEFTTKLEKLLQHEKRRDEIGMNAYFYIKENHSTENEANFYRSILTDATDLNENINA